MTSPEILDLSVVYGDDRDGLAYGVKSNRYRVGYHRGADYRETEGVYPNNYSIPHDVAAIGAGVVTFVGKAPLGKIGHIVEILRDEDGIYETHCHLVPRSDLYAGRRVARGEKLGRTAGHSDAWEYRGTPLTWTAPHDHIVFSYRLNAAWDDMQPTLDPAIYIKRAIAAQEAEDHMPLSDDDAKKVAIALRDLPMEALNEGKEYEIPAETFGRRIRRDADYSARNLVLNRRIRLELAGLRAALAALSDARGTDTAAILAAIDKLAGEDDDA